jgi:hypothetical protein
MGIPKNVKPYKVTKMLPTPTGLVVKDAQRISTGGSPVMMVGNED